MPTQLPKDNQNRNFKRHKQIVQTASLNFNIWQSFWKSATRPKQTAQEMTIDLAGDHDQTEVKQSIKYLTHTEEPSKKVSKSTQLSTQWKKINADILLLGIAIGCVLGVVYFIFGGLQPILLKGYIKNTIQNLTMLNQNFLNQTNGLISFNNNLLNATSYNLLADCSPEQKYQNLTQDLTKLENLERALLPNQQLQEPPKFNGFKDRGVRLRYQQYYKFYEQNLQSLKESVLEDSRDFLVFANHRNNFIEGCILLTQANSLTQEIINFCAELPKKNEEYKSNHDPSFWSALEPLLTENINLCNQLAQDQKNFLKNKLSWLSSFGKIASFLPDIDKNSNLISQALEGMKTENSRVEQDLYDIYNRKTSFLGMWYLLEF